MLTMRNITAALLLLLLLTAPALAQTEQAKPAISPTVTVAVTAQGVRFTALGNVKQLRLEVLQAGGVVLFDSGWKPGNVRDWLPGDADGQSLPDGTYLCAVTIRDLAERLSIKQGTVMLQNGQAALPLGEAEPASALAPDTSLAPHRADEQAAMTLVAHDGRDGQVSRTRGALTFRVGDFFSGLDKEQMRVTAEGEVGIGTPQPQAKLDVAGDIRATGALHAAKGIEFADGTVQTTGLSGRKDAQGHIMPAVAGTGTAGRYAMWIDNEGTLGDSLLADVGTNVVNNGTNIQMTEPASSYVDTNLIFMNGNDRTTGVIASSTPAFLAQNGPYFALRGNSYEALAGQRGLFAISAGNVPGPTGKEGSLLFFTGDDQLRMFINPAGNVGIGTNNPQAKLQVAGGVMFDGLRLESNHGSLSVNVIGGFSGNSVGNVVGATIAGGGTPVLGGLEFGYYPNQVLASFGTIGGGIGNTVRATSPLDSDGGGFIGGGFANSVNGRNNTIGGGGVNTTSNIFTTVGGGANNTASGAYATVPGGRFNTAAGGYSFAAGRRANVAAAANGTFVWADSTDADFTVTTPDQFAIRATNGLSLAVDAGATKTVQIGEHYRDNALVAWASINGSGAAASNSFGITSIEHTGTGIYTITVTAAPGSAALLAPIAIAEIDNAPTSAATLRIVAVNQQTANTFQVFINDGSGTAVDNQFIFMATAR